MCNQGYICILRLSRDLEVATLYKYVNLLCILCNQEYMSVATTFRYLLTFLEQFPYELTLHMINNS